MKKNAPKSRRKENTFAFPKKTSATTVPYTVSDTQKESAWGGEGVTKCLSIVQKSVNKTSKEITNYSKFNLQCGPEIALTFCLKKQNFDKSSPCGENHWGSNLINGIGETVELLHESFVLLLQHLGLSRAANQYL